MTLWDKLSYQMSLLITSLLTSSHTKVKMMSSSVAMMMIYT